MKYAAKTTPATTISQSKSRIVKRNMENVGLSFPVEGDSDIAIDLTCQYLGLAKRVNSLASIDKRRFNLDPFD